MESFFIQIINKLRVFSFRNETMTESNSGAKLLDSNSEMNFLAITANVGTLFEDPEGIQEVWKNEVFKIVKEKKPKFIALHCQEIGGKDYKSSMEPVKKFFNQMMEAEELKDFNLVRGYLDGDFEDVHQYTALGNIYFVHESVTDVELYIFTDDKFEKVKGKEIFSKNITDLSSARKEKFEQDFFPDCKWSRKGYCRVRWKIDGKVVEFVNIHLFHDDNNLVAVRTSPSTYSTYRMRALQFVLKRLQEVNPCENNISFIFGDFNFRLDVKSLVQKLCPGSKEQVIRSDDDVIRMLYRHPAKYGSPVDKDEDDVTPSMVSNGDKGNRNGNNDVIVKLEKKLFEVEDQILFPDMEFTQLQGFDKEPKEIGNKLKEFKISFPPTYPFSEDVKKCSSYMDTRCPSWCDRILLTPESWDWIKSQDNKGNVCYDTIGKQSCMGDHKPVFLSFTVKLSENTEQEQSNSQTNNNKNEKSPTDTTAVTS